jgi:endonuclease III
LIWGSSVVGPVLVCPNATQRLEEGRSAAACTAQDTAAPTDEANYQTLVSLMLSSQTRDTVNAATMVKLRAHGLSVDNILDRTSDAQLFELIREVGFNKTKVGYIRAATQVLRDVHGGVVPDTFQELTALRGVGPKMALIVLRVVSRRPFVHRGICVNPF